MSNILKRKIRSAFATGICIILCASTCLTALPQTAMAATASDGYLDANGVHVYRDTPEDVESAKYDVKVNGTDVKAIKYDKNGNNFDIARFATDEMSPEITVTLPNEEINTVKVLPERYYDQEDLQVSADKHTLTFTMNEESNLRYVYVMINGGPADQAGKPYLALINDPEETVPDMTGENVLNFKTFSEEYLAAHPNSEVETAVEAGTTSGGVAYDAGQLVDNNTAQVRFPNKRKMLDNDVTYALQAALDEIYKEGSKYDTLYFPDGTYICSGLEIKNRNGKHVNIYLDEGALVKNRLQECMQAMEPAIGIWDSSDITISGRGMFDGNGVANYSKDRHDAKDSCHQGGVMIMRSSNIVFNDTYVRDTKQWNWESHGSKHCTLNNIKGLTPYNQPWVDGLDMASAQDLTINGALTMGNDDNFASGHYNPSDGFTNTVPGYDQYNSDCLNWDTEDSFNVNVSNTLGWSFNGGNGIRMGHNTYGHQMKNYTFDNVNTSNFRGGGRGITVQNSTGTYPRYESIIIKNSSFDTTRVGTNMDINGRADNMIDTVTVENCWFSNGDIPNKFNNITNLTVKELYMGGKRVTVSNFARVTANNITNFVYDWADNHAPEFTAPTESTYNAKVGEAICFNVAATDADDDAVTLSAANLPEGATFDTATGTFAWTPSETQLGSAKVTFTATDAKDVATTKEVTFNINDKVGNTAPKFEAVEGAPFTVSAGNTLTFTVKATDAENDTVTLSAGDLPRGASFDAATGTFSWKPSASQVGEKEITFTAVDQWGASAQTTVKITVDAGLYESVEAAPTQDSYLASWKDEKNKNYAGNEYLRVRRMPGAAADTGKYGLFGEKVTSLSDANDAKISVLSFDAAELKANVENLEKAELELTLINRRNNSSTGTDRLLAVPVTTSWEEASVTWNTHPEWDIDQVSYSDEFKVDTNGEVNNKTGITASTYDGTKVTIDVTDLVKNLKDTDTVLSLAVCDEKGYELAFASTEGAAKLGEDKAAAPVLRLSVKKESKPEVEAGQVVVSEDTFAGSWSSDQSKNYGSVNFLRTSYSDNSQGALGTTSGSDNKVTYLKFDLSSIDVEKVSSIKLQMSLLGVRNNEGKDQTLQILTGVTEDDTWSESALTWKNKPAVSTSADDLAASEEFNTGSVVSNDPAQIATPNGTKVLTDVTDFILAAKKAGKSNITFVVNVDGSSSSVDKARRIYFVSKEGAASYPNATEMAPKLILNKYEETPEQPTLTGITLTAPTKTVYEVGETLDTTGMKVLAVYSDNTTKEVDLKDVTITGFDSSKVVAEQTVTVSYEGKEATFTVEIKNTALENAKTAAIEEINAYVDTQKSTIAALKGLSEEELAAYTQKAEDAKTAAIEKINAAEDQDTVAKATTAGKTALDEVVAEATALSEKNIADKEAAEKLQKAKEDAVKAVNDKAASITAEIEKLSNLSADQKDAYKANVTSAAKEAETEINAAADETKVAEAQKTAETALDKVLTDAKAADQKAEPKPNPEPKPDPEPEPKPEPKKNGLSEKPEADGNMYYYRDGVIATDVNTIINNKEGWYYVRNGKVDFSFTGLSNNKNGWWRVENGKVNFNYNGITNNKIGWWKVTNGKVDFNYTGVSNNENGWWYVRNGKVDFTANTIANNQNGWWKIVNGKVDFNYTGVSNNQNGWWRVENGKVNFNFNGIANNQNGWWYIRNGKVDFSKNGYIKVQGRFYQVVNGKVRT